jgi:pimeloyl-ACP methyl ester carboxylesterase
VVVDQISFVLPRAGLTVRGQRAGRRGGVSTLCLHGWLDNSGSFEPSTTLQYLDYVAVVLELVAELGWTRFRLVGHSRGGAVSVLVAGVRPEKVSRLVLIDAIGPLSATPEQARRSVARYLNAYLDNGGNPVYRSRLQATKARVQLADMLMDTAEHLLVRDLRPVPDGYSWRGAARLTYPFTMVFTEEQVLAFIRGISALTLLVTAERAALKEPFYPKRIESVPDLRYVVVEGGHHLHMENVRPVAEFIRKFFKDETAEFVNRTKGDDHG